MTTAILMPAVDPLAGTDYYTGVVIETKPCLSDEERVIWRSSIARTCKHEANRDAIEAVANIAYQRRHQLDLWQEHGIGDDPYLA